MAARRCPGPTAPPTSRFSCAAARPGAWRRAGRRHRRPVRQRAVRPARRHPPAAAGPAGAGRGRAARGRAVARSRRPAASRRRAARPAGHRGRCEIRGAPGQPYTLRALDAPPRSGVAAREPGGSPPSPPARAATRCRPPAAAAHGGARRAAAHRGQHGAADRRRRRLARPLQPARPDQPAVPATGRRRRGVQQHRRADPARPRRLGTCRPDFYACRWSRRPARSAAWTWSWVRPGRATAAGAPLPPDPVIPLGVQTLTPGQSLVLDGGRHRTPRSGCGRAARPGGAGGGSAGRHDRRRRTASVPVQVHPAAR